MKLLLSRMTLILGLFLLFSLRGAASTGVPPFVLSYEERVVFSYLLAGIGQGDDVKLGLVRRLGEQTRHYFRQPAREVVVRDFQEFLREYQGNWAPSYSPMSELELLEESGIRGRVLIRAATPSLAAEIERFHAERKDRLSAWLGQKTETLARFLFRAGGGALYEPFSAESLYLKASRESEEILKQEFEKIGDLGREIAESERLKDLDPGVRSFLQAILQEYFSRMSIETKVAVLGRILSGNLDADPVAKFEHLVLSAGPQFQKLLQVVAREARLSEDLLEIFRKLESKAPQIPGPLVERMLEAERASYDWVSYETKALGVGTMAQVHRGKVRTRAGVRDVVIRFLKPDIARRVDEDHRILSEIAPVLDQHPVLRERGFPRLTPIVADLTRTVRDELSLKATIQRQKEGRRVYSADLFFAGETYRNTMRLSVPDVLAGPPESRLMVQEMVPGKKLDSVAADFGEVVPDLKKVIVEQIATVWLREVLFRSGFYHSDLHQGNYMVEFAEPGIVVNILDFGMGGRISREMQKAILLLGAGIDILKASAITTAFWSIRDADRTRLTRAAFAREVESVTERMIRGEHPLWSMAEWSTWAMEKGVQFPFEFVGLNRGMVILEKSLEDSGSSLRLSSLSKKIARQHPRRLWADLRSSGEMTIRDLIRLGWLAITDGTAVQGHPEAKPSSPPPVRPAVRPAMSCQKVFLLTGS